MTLTHFANPADFQSLSMLGYNAALITLDPGRPGTWQAAFDAADAAGMQLIVGGYPPPYQYNSGNWTITSSGIALLKFLQSRPDLVIAVYVFNEPYYTNPFTGQPSPCGYFSAADLRTLRTVIQGVWHGAKIYHDLGNPAEWAPGGAHASTTTCVGNKYADQTGVADYVGVWVYPFTPRGADVTAGLANLSNIANFVLNSMQPAQPISLNQAFACPGCGPPLVFPTRQQVLDWNCGSRVLPFAGVDWYPWRRFIPAYTDALADHPYYWPLTTAAACSPGMGADVTGVSAASGMPFVAPNSLVSMYGVNLTSSPAYQASDPLPTSVEGRMLQVQDAAGVTQRAPLAYVSSGQVNFLLPSTVAPGQAALKWTGDSGPVSLGTILVRNVAPALFTADGSGVGVVAGQALLIANDGTQSLTPLFQCSGTGCSSVPVNLGGAASVYLTLYGTGIRNYATGVSCWIKGVAVPVAYAGPQGQYDGLDQVNVGPLPNFSGSGEVDLIVGVDGVPSNYVRVNFQ